MTRSIQQDLDFLHAYLAICKSDIAPEERIQSWSELLKEYFPQAPAFPFSFKTRRSKLFQKNSLHESITYIALGQDLETLGRLDEALEAYWQAKSHTCMAQVYRKLGQRENALACLNRAEKNDRSTPEVLLLEAEIHGELGDYDEVTRLLKLAFCRTPENEHTPTVYQKIREISERFSVPIPRVLPA